MSTPHPADRRLDTAHPDRGELADEIAGVAAPAVAEHLAGCRDCSERLDALRAASLSVTDFLRADPEPELPAAIAARFAEAIAAESAARPVASAPAAVPAVAPPDRSSSRPGRRREGWWARHTRLGGVLVTAAALVVVGGGGTVVANMVRNDNANQAGMERTAATQDDSAAPEHDLGAKATPLGAVAGAIALHQSAFVDEVDDLIHTRTRTLRSLTPAQTSCASETLSGTDLEGATLTAVGGAFTLDATPVQVVVAAHDGTRTALAISGCSTGQPQLAARGDLP